MNYKLMQITDAFLSISLDKMDRVQLMNRTDTKFVGTVNHLEKLLVKLFRDYYILEIDKKRVLPYHTIYFDSKDFQLYNSHHNGKLNRYKIRFREYEISRIGFLEIKKKNNKNRTDKKRIQSSYQHSELVDTQISFIATTTSLIPNDLEEKLSNHFDRITLVGKEKNERLTIDLNLQFSSPDGNFKKLADFAIIELKQDQNSGWSPIKQIIKENHFKAHGFSKYCIGTILLYPHIKHNRFKQHIRLLEKLCTNQIKIENHEQPTGNIQYDIAV